MDDDPSLPLFDGVYVVGFPREQHGDPLLHEDSGAALKSCYDTWSSGAKPTTVWSFTPSTVPANALSINDASSKVPFFCFPDQNSISPCKIEAFKSDLYVFALTGDGGKRSWGFSKRLLPPGPGGRYEVGNFRLPECICVLSRRPCFEALCHLVAVACGLRSLALARDPPDHAMTQLLALLEDLHRASAATVDPPRLGYGGAPPPFSPRITAGGYSFCALPSGASGGDSLLVPLCPLLLKMGPRSLAVLLSAILCERRIICVSESLQNLSQCIYAALGLVYPFRWQHLFIPVLPESMLSHVCAPMPFLVGVTSNLLEATLRQPHSGVFVANLDNGEIDMHGDLEPPPDLFAGVKEKWASATNKLDKVYARTKKIFGKFGPDKSAASGNGPGLSGPGDRDRDQGGLQMDLASYLFAELTSIYNQCTKSHAPQDAYAHFTYEDSQLRCLMLLFFLCIFGEAGMIARPQGFGPRGEPKAYAFDRAYFLRHRLERGDSEPLLSFLDEFTHAQMFEQFARVIGLIELRRSSSRGGSGGVSSSTGMRNNGSQEEMMEQIPHAPRDFVRCVDELVRNRTSTTTSNIQFLRKIVTSVLGTSSLENTSSPPGSPIRPTRLGFAESQSWSHPSPIMLIKDMIERGRSLYQAEREVQELGKQSLDSSFAFVIMNTIWSGIEDSKGSKWRRSARALWILIRLLRARLANVIALCLGHSGHLRGLLTQFSRGIASASSERGTLAIRRLLRAVLATLMDLRLLGDFQSQNNPTAVAAAVSSSNPPSSVVELLPFGGRPLDFQALHTLVGECCAGERTSLADFRSIVGVPPPVPPKPPELQSPPSSPPLRNSDKTRSTREDLLDYSAWDREERESSSDNDNISQQQQSAQPHWQQNNLYHNNDQSLDLLSGPPCPPARPASPVPPTKYLTQPPPPPPPKQSTAVVGSARQRQTGAASDWGKAQGFDLFDGFQAPESEPDEWLSKPVHPPRPQGRSLQQQQQSAALAFRTSDLITGGGSSSLQAGTQQPDQQLRIHQGSSWSPQHFPAATPQLPSSYPIAPPVQHYGGAMGPQLPNMHQGAYTATPAASSSGSNNLISASASQVQGMMPNMPSWSASSQSQTPIQGHHGLQATHQSRQVALGPQGAYQPGQVGNSQQQPSGWQSPQLQLRGALQHNMAPQQQQQHIHHPPPPQQYYPHQQANPQQQQWQQLQQHQQQHYRHQQQQQQQHPQPPQNR